MDGASESKHHHTSVALLRYPVGLFGCISADPEVLPTQKYLNPEPCTSNASYEDDLQHILLTKSLPQSFYPKPQMSKSHWKDSPVPRRCLSCLSFTRLRGCEIAGTAANIFRFSKPREWGTHGNPPGFLHAEPHRGALTIILTRALRELGHQGP